MLLNAFYVVWVQILDVLEVICILEIQGQQLDIPVLNRQIQEFMLVWVCIGIFCFTSARNFRTFM